MSNTTTFNLRCVSALKRMRVCLSLCVCIMHDLTNLDGDDYDDGENCERFR